MAIDLFSIGRFTVHGYGLMIGIGFMAATIVGSILAKRRGLSDSDYTNMAILVLVIGFMGGKLLHMIVEWKALLTDPMSVIGSAGFVVYGGIITGIMTIVVYCKVKKIEIFRYMDLFAVSVPLNQALGRIGCLLAGCCYGKETASAFSLVFPPSSMAPPGVKLLPTQPIMAAGNFLIFAVLLILYVKNRLDAPGTATGLYLILYSAGRFAIEFLRDDERGSVGFLSTSQFIAIFTFAAGVAIIAFVRKKKEQS